MSKLYFTAAALAAAIAGIAVAQADGPLLNVKPGLWEMTSVNQMSGAMPIPADELAKLTPDQKAKVEAMMGNMMKAQPPNVEKQCLTEKQIQKGPDFMDKSDKSCTQSVLDHTGTKLDMKVVCTGEHPTTSTISFKALSPQSIAGTVQVLMITDGKQTTINSTVTGKWLASDCGNVKPSDE